MSPLGRAAELFESDGTVRTQRKRFHIKEVIDRVAKGIPEHYAEISRGLGKQMRGRHMGASGETRKTPVRVSPYANKIPGLSTRVFLTGNGGSSVPRDHRRTARVKEVVDAYASDVFFSIALGMPMLGTISDGDRRNIVE